MLKHTLVYRVEHVFLIHRHTSLLIAHAASQDATSQDPQLVSSMLAAIQDFVRDSFSEQQGLELPASRRSVSVVRTGAVRDSGRGDPGQSSGGVCTKDFATYWRGFTRNARKRWRPSRATAPASPMSRRR